MTVTEPVTGILDTSTVILLERLDEGDLPAAPLITAVTLAELMIAATAIANRLPLYTVNPADFEGVVDLDLRRIAHPDHTAP